MEISTRSRRQSQGAPGRGLLSILEIVALGVVSVYLVLLVIPAWNGVETWCFLDGPETTAANRYVTALTVVGVATWLGMIFGLGWFLGLAAVALIVTSAMGPQPCQGSFF